MQENTDAIIIGAGQAGGPLAVALASYGWKTVLIEEKHVGGTCVNEGCTPTKTMIASARVAFLARRAAEYGVQTGPISVQMERVRQRKRDIVESFRSGSKRHIEETDGLELVSGRAKFVGCKRVAITQDDGEIRTFSADTIVIDVGARPRLPSFPGLEEVSVLDSTTIMELGEAPEHLLVIGGGYVGLEFGQMFRRFGSRVTIVQRGKQLLTREDEDIASEVASILRDEGVEVLLDAEPLRARPLESNGMELTVRTPSEEIVLTGSHLLAASGRQPNTDRLKLGETGLAMDDRGFIPVNARLETTVPGIFVVGDAKGGPAFTHIAYDDFRILRANLLNGGRASTMDRMVPYTVFIDPQLGRIGLSETEAMQQGLDYRVAKIPMSQVARALETDETRGLMKALVDPASGRILGAAILGVEGGEVMSVLQMAMMGGVPFSQIRDGVFAHPTLSESLNNLFMRLEAPAP